MPEELDVSEETYTRRSARVLLLDAEDRVLLFCYRREPDDPAKGRYWLTPGGGVDEGEPIASAAVRELREETGLVVSLAELGPHVALSSGYAEFGVGSGIFRDDFFFHRTAGHQVDTGGFQEYEITVVSEYKWWTLDELTSTSETVYPLGLAALMTDLAAGRIPAEPIRLQWHH